jgi:hypothetical protein
MRLYLEKTLHKKVWVEWLKLYVQKKTIRYKVTEVDGYRKI